MIFERCKCGELVPAHLAHEHKCAQKSRPNKNPTTSPVAKTEASSVSSPSSRRIDTPPKPRVDTVDTPPVSTRLQRWRAKNREAYNARMRAYRARQKAPE